METDSISQISGLDDCVLDAALAGFPGPPAAPAQSRLEVIVRRWSSDGKKLVLGSDDSWGASQPQYIDPKAGAGLYIVNADGSGFTRIPGVTDAIDPDWRP